MAADFSQFGFPVWFRNVVGGIKVFFSIMLIAGIWNYHYAVIAAAGIALMMTAAVYVHIKEGDSFQRIWPALGLAILSIGLALLANYYKFEVKDNVF